MKKKRNILRKKKHIKKNFFRFFLMLLILTSILSFVVLLKDRYPRLRIASRETLQIGTFYITPTSYIAPTANPFLPPKNPPPTFRPLPSPTPTQAPSASCGIANENVLIIGQDEKGNCCVQDGPGRAPTKCCPGVGQANFGPQIQYPDAPPTAEFWCNAKPVIYLYPEKPTTVTVSVKVPGQIFVSIPPYPTGGWKNILAHPGGKLTYRGKDYTELFYESTVAPITPPTKGFIISSIDTEQFLRDFTVKLGLQKHESDELISYWIPKLQELHAPYLFVSVFDSDAKDKIDHVEITPKPDIFIAFILYFKPLQETRAVEPLTLPDVPTRTGFTAVEWGGIIDTH